MNARKLHRQLAPILFFPLMLSGLTGVAYRLGNTWFGLPKAFGQAMMSLHEGRFLGKPLVPLYVLFSGLGLLLLSISGLLLIKRRLNLTSTSKPTPISFRKVHFWLAPLFFLPLFVSAATGIAFRLGKAWFNLPSAQAELLLSIHQGTYFGYSLRAFYILFLGLGLIMMLVTGIEMTGLLRRRKV